MGRHVLLLLLLLRCSTAAAAGEAYFTAATNAVATNNNTTAEAAAIQKREWLRQKDRALYIKHNYSGVYECPVPGEAYSAAYFVTKATFLRHRIAEDRLVRGQGNMEGASHALFRRSKLVKTVDLFDFYIEHLSWYERRIPNKKKAEADPFVVQRVLERLTAQTSHLLLKHTEDPPPTIYQKMVAVMPFYATPGGDAGHSSLFTRRAYLKLTIDSLRPFFGGNVVVCVASEFDFEYLTSADFNRTVGPLFEVLKYHKQFRPSRLGFATVFLTQRAIEFSEKWRKFRYVFYTESDQIFRSRSPENLLALINSRPYNVFLIPHRVMPVPMLSDFVTDTHTDEDRHRETRLTKQRLTNEHVLAFSKNEAKQPVHRLAPDFEATMCCFSREPCSTNRDSWLKFMDPRLKLFQIATVPENELRQERLSGDFHPTHNDSYTLVAGEGNFLRQQFRPCHLLPRRTTTRSKQQQQQTALCP